MAKFTNDQQNKINKALLEKSLFELLNTHLAENDLGDFEVEAIHFKAKTGNNDITCPIGYEPREVCSIDGECTVICVPKI